MNERNRSDGVVDPPCSCKVGRAVAAYGLADLDEQLRERHFDGDSLRDLERFVNCAVLRGALRECGADLVADVDAVYEALTGDDVSAGKRTEIRDRLAHAGVDVEGVEGDFVSYQTVRTHLRECLDVETTRESEITTDDARGTIEWARSRSEGIVERTLQRLAGAGELSAGDVEVSHVVRANCTDCGVSMPVDEFVDRGGCECEGAESNGS